MTNGAPAAAAVGPGGVLSGPGLRTTIWPDVTVVLPTRGRPELVRLAVQGVLDQDYAGHVRCLVVHDQEERDTSLVEFAVGRAGRAVEVCENDHGSGLAGSRNAGLSRTTTDVVASCDDDDVWWPAKLRLQVQRLLDDHSLLVVGAGIRLHMGPGQDVDWVGPSDCVSLPDLARGRRKELHSSTLVMRREVFDRAGTYDEKLPHSYAEDYEWLLRAVRHGPIGVVRTPLATIKKDGTSWFRQRSEVVAAALEYLLDTHPELTLSPRGHARILGQIAFAHASLGHRGQAFRYVARSVRRYPLAPQAALALAQIVTGGDPQVLLRQARRFGRGLA